MTHYIEKNYIYQQIKNSIEIAQESHQLFINKFKKMSTKMHIQNNLYSPFHFVAHFNKPMRIDEEELKISELSDQKIIEHSLSKCKLEKHIKRV